MCLIDGIVSVASFETLIKWLYRGQADFPKGLTAAEEISKVIEFARLCDMVGVTGVEEMLAADIKSLLLKEPSVVPELAAVESESTGRGLSTRFNYDASVAAYLNPLSGASSSPVEPYPMVTSLYHPGSYRGTNASTSHLPTTSSHVPSPPPRRCGGNRNRHAFTMPDLDAYTRPVLRSHSAHYTDHILNEHLHAVSELPRGHAVRQILATALVKEYLKPINGIFNYIYEMDEIPSLARDVLEQVKAVLDHGRVSFKDPITGVKVNYGGSEKSARGSRKRRHDSDSYSSDSDY